MIVQSCAPKGFKLRPLFVLALIAWLLIPFSSNVAQTQSEKPLNKEQVIGMLNDIRADPDLKQRQKGAKHLKDLVQQYGVDFPSTKDDKLKFQSAGADAELIAIIGKYYRPDQDAVKYYNQGTEHDQSESFDKAVADYSNAIRLDPKYADAYYGRGRDYLRSGRTEEAEKDFNEVIRLKPDYGDAYYSLGLIYNDLAQSDKVTQSDKEIQSKKAIEYFITAVQKNPVYAEAHFMLGQIYLRNNQISKAKADLEQAIQQGTETLKADAYYYLGKAYFASPGEREKASKAYEEAIRLKPKDAESHYDLGMTYYYLGSDQKNLGLYRKAIESLKKAIGYNTSEVPKAYYYLCKSCEEAIQLKSDDAELHYELGKAYNYLGRHKEALDQCDLLRPLDEKLANDLRNLINR